jgi:hypothetical protein
VLRCVVWCVLGLYCAQFAVRECDDRGGSARDPALSRRNRSAQRRHPTAQNSVRALLYRAWPAFLSLIFSLCDACSANTFQGTKCHACTSSLSLPAVHFLCMHSFHERCVVDSDRQCPICAPEFRKGVSPANAPLPLRFPLPLSRPLLTPFFLFFFFVCD